MNIKRYLPVFLMHGSGTTSKNVSGQLGIGPTTANNISKDTSHAISQCLSGDITVPEQEQQVTCVVAGFCLIAGMPQAISAINGMNTCWRCCAA